MASKNDDIFGPSEKMNISGYRRLTGEYGQEKPKRERKKTMGVDGLQDIDQMVPEQIVVGRGAYGWSGQANSMTLKSDEPEEFLMVEGRKMRLKKDQQR